MGCGSRDPFPNNMIPSNRINPTARAIMQYYPDPNYTTAGAAPWQNNLDYPEHFNKDLFWNWVGKVDHNFSTNDRVFFRWGENERNEVRNTSAIRSGPAQDGQLPLWRANRALVADWVHVFGAGTVFNLRGSYTYFLEWSYSQDSLGFDATQFWPSSLVGQMPSQAISGIFPRIELADYVSLSRGSSPNRNRNYTIQPNVSMTRGAHNIRSGLDLRWTNVFNENYNNSGGLVQFNQQFTRSTLNSTSVLEGNSFASFLLGAPSSGQVDVNPDAPLQVVLRGPVDPGRLETQQQVDAEPRLPVGLQRLGDGRRQHAELRVRSDAGQSRVGARQSAGVGRHPVRGRRRRPGSAVEVRQEQLPVPGRHGLLDQREDRVPRGLGQVLPEPDQSVVQCRVLPEHADHHVARRRPDADLLAFEPLAERDPGPARQLARPAHLPRPQSELLEP